MTSASNFYYFGRPANEITSTLYPKNQKIATQFSQNIVITRIALTALFTAYVVFRIGLMWSWPVVVLGAVFARYTAYQHLVGKDPLVEAMYKIAGGEEAYDRLPEIQLVDHIQQSESKKIFEAIKQIEWEELQHPLFRATTLDGRKILIVKGLSYSREVGLLGSATCQTVFAFVEKMGPYVLCELSLICMKVWSVFSKPSHALTLKIFKKAGPSQHPVFERLLNLQKCLASYLPNLPTNFIVNWEQETARMLKS